MTHALLLTLCGFLSLYVLWALYLAVMCLKRARDEGTLTSTAYALGLPLLFIGLAVDALCNLVVLTVLFAEVPRELLVTSRLKRHYLRGKGWRKKLAIWFAIHMTDAFDPSGPHVMR